MTKTMTNIMTQTTTHIDVTHNMYDSYYDSQMYDSGPAWTTLHVYKSRVEQGLGLQLVLPRLTYTLLEYTPIRETNNKAKQPPDRILSDHIILITGS